MVTIPGTRWRMLNQRVSGKPLPKGLDAVWDSGAGYIRNFVPHKALFLKRAEKIMFLERDFSKLTDSRLRDKAKKLHRIFRLKHDTPDHLEQAFALVREVASRQIGEKPFLVQVMGALAIDNGCIAEMATGEGKTLAATMAVTVAGWRGKGCHVLTVNDYLARRDADWMRPIYHFCGLNVSYIEQAMPSQERRQAYDSDITYCTNKEVTADFLRDRLKMGSLRGLGSTLLDKLVLGQGAIDKLVQRGLHFAIVDEADSILVDEAVTPLIISTEVPNPEQKETFLQAAEIAALMLSGVHYTVDSKYREIELTDKGRQQLTVLLKTSGDICQGARRSEETIIQAITAKEFYLRDKHYVLEDGKVIIVDEFTGRLMPDRTWRNGLHEAVEAKEKVQVNSPKETRARISFQRFFRIYNKLAGMTGTAQEARSEFWQIYHLPIVSVPTNRPCIRKVLPAIILPNQSEKWEVILNEVGHIHEIGRPILIGTRSVQASEHLSRLLQLRNLPHQVLNAIHHRREAEIVAGAGQVGRITVATNMAGRGTDIKLGRGVAEIGGLHVLATEFNESARIDRQLFGRGARQGDPGSAQAIVSLEDEYVCRYAGNFATWLRKRYNSLPGNTWINLANGSFRFAQFRAERLALRQRKTVLKTDHWLDENLGFAGVE